ncbi:hypothetical protein [Corynebacterium phocae]|uniref:hypothetical protein n=1 Tax=Corynebacterium phocae TaxID=161895 RepID=UPI000951539A|nr:hypothetical protein [Corynebacterium phocae]KAA8721929.1 hypothetical protein F4V58_09640 [Corynebacterium phocae]
MNKIGKLITTVVIVAFALALAGMVAVASGRAANPVNGSLLAKLETISTQNLRATAISPADVYGDEWSTAFIVCPGVEADDISQALSINAADLGIEGTVEDNDNYLLVRKDAGQTYAEHFDRHELDLCSGQPVPSFDSRQMIPLLKTEDGGWVLAG